MTAELYQASPIKRTRATKAEVEARREALLDIIEVGRPMTVRQVFYQATVRGVGREGRKRLRQGADGSHGHAPGRIAWGRRR
jgi:hypothetical protein